MRILLTGGRGMVGRNFLEHPAADDHDIASPTSSELNLCDANAVFQYVNNFSPDMVVHAAGRVGGIQANIREPVSFLVDNLDMGRNIVMAARKSGVKRLLNLGSSCMYPRNAPNPLREEMLLTGQLEPTNEGYALAKLTTVKLCEYITRENTHFQYKTLIPANIYGRHDKFDPAHSHMIPAVIHKIHHAKLNNAKQVAIWGTGKARREFIYASDVADCMWKAVSNFDTLPSTLNVGLGLDFSILDYYESIARIIGYEGHFFYDSTKPEGIPQKMVSIEKLKEWGWSATTALDDGIARTYQFYLQGSQA